MRETRRNTGPLLRLAALALCFLLGDLCGLALASGMPEAAGAELRRYLARRGTVSQPTGQAVLSTVGLYLRYPLLAAVFSSAPGGGLLLGGTAAVWGFLLSFSVGCFAAAFGETGLPLAAAVMGLRCLVTLPCFFALAVSPWPSHARRLTAAQARRAAVRRLILCGAVLLLGACADLYLTPIFLRRALALAAAGDRGFLP